VAGPEEQLGNGIVASAAGNLFVAGEAAGKLTVWSLSSTGQLRWQHTGAGGSAHAITAVADGVVVAGHEANGWYVAKLDDKGGVVWEHTLATGSAANGIAAGADGSVVVTGHRLAGRLLLRVEKLQPDGVLAWEYEAISPDGPAKGHAVAVDAQGNSFVVADFATDWLVLSLDPGGRRRWYFTHDGGGGVTNRDQVHAIVVKSPGEIVVSGRVPRAARPRRTWSGRLAYDVVR
jgi:hypothetical protein